MAEKSLTFNLFGHDVSASSAVGEFATKAHGHISGLVGDLAKLAGGFFALQGVVEFGKSAVEAASAAETANTKLDQTFKNVHSSLTANSSAVVDLKAHMAEYGFTGAAVDDALAKATTGFGNSDKAMKIMQVSADLAKFKNLDLASAVLIVQKGMEGQLRPLRQLGIDLPVAAGNSRQVELAQRKLADAQQAVNDVLGKYPNAADAASKGHAAFEAATKKVTAAEKDLADKSSAGQQILDTLSERLNGQAAKAADTYAGKVAALSAKWDEFQVKIGQAVMPALSGLVSFLSDSVMPAFDKLFTNLDKMKGNLPAALGAGSNSKSGGPLSGAAWQNGMNQASSAVGNPKSYNPLNENTAFQTGWDQLMAKMQNGWDQLMGKLGHGWSQLMGKFGNGWIELMGKFGNGWNQMMAGIGAMFASTTNGKMWAAVGSLLGKFGNGWNQMMAGFGNGWVQLMGRLGNGWNQIAAAFGNGWNQMMGGFANGWTQLMGKFGEGWNQIAGAFRNGWNQILAFFSNGWNGLMASLGNGWNQISGAFRNGWSQLMGSFGSAWSGLMGTLSNGWGQIAGAFRSGWSGLMATFTSGWNELIGFITGHPITAHGSVVWSNTTPPAPSGGGGGTLVARPFASGGIVRARPGGTPAIIGEAGHDEAVVPLTPEGMKDAGLTGTTNYNTFNITESTDGVGLSNSVMRRLNFRGAV